MLTGDRLLFMLTIFVWFSFLCLQGTLVENVYYLCFYNKKNFFV